MRKHACLQVVPTYLVVTKQGNLLAGKCGTDETLKPINKSIDLRISQLSKIFS